MGKTISESGLRDKDINPLSLHRNGKVFTNPKAERVLEPEDKILCYGKIEVMKELIPEKTRRRRRPRPKKLRKDEIEEFKESMSHKE